VPSRPTWSCLEVAKNGVGRLEAPVHGTGAHSTAQRVRHGEGGSDVDADGGENR